MRTLALGLVLGGIALTGCKKTVAVDLGVELGEQVTILEPVWEADPKGERGKLGVPVRLVNVTDETVSVSQLKVDIISSSERQCGETKSLERTIATGGKIKMRIDIVCHWDDVKNGFRTEGGVTVSTATSEAAVLSLSKDNVKVSK